MSPGPNTIVRVGPLAARGVEWGARCHAETTGEAVTINLHAKSNFDKGDVGRVTGHEVTKVHGFERGSSLVTALQAVRAGENGWFETKTN
jgi:hypothetical protein